MAKLIVRETGAALPVTDEQIQFLIDHLEEESYDDQDYYLTLATIDMLEREGAEPALVAALVSAVGQREGIEVVWEGRAPIETA